MPQNKIHRHKDPRVEQEFQQLWNWLRSEEFYKEIRDKVGPLLNDKSKINDRLEALEP